MKMENRTYLRGVKLLGAVIVIVGAALTLARLVELEQDLDDKCHGNQCQEFHVFWWFWAFQIFVLLFLAAADGMSFTEPCCLTSLGLTMVASTLDQYAADIFRTGVLCGGLAMSGWAIMAAGDIVIIIGVGYRHIFPSGQQPVPLGTEGEPEGQALKFNVDPPGQIFKRSPFLYVFMAVFAFGSWLLAVAGAREWCGSLACSPLKFYWWLMCLEFLVLFFTFFMRGLKRLGPWTRACTFLLAMPTTFLALWSHHFVDFSGEDYAKETALKVAATGTIGLTITNYVMTFSLGFQMRSRDLKNQPCWVGLSRVATVILGIAGWVIAFIGTKRTQNFLCNDNDEIFDEDLFCNKFDLFWWFFALETAVLLVFLAGLFVDLKAGWTSVSLTFAAVACVWPIFMADKFRTYPVIENGSRDELGFVGHVVMACAFLNLVVLEVF